MLCLCEFTLDTCKTLNLGGVFTFVFERSLEPIQNTRNILELQKRLPLVSYNTLPNFE